MSNRVSKHTGPPDLAELSLFRRWFSESIPTPVLVDDRSFLSVGIVVGGTLDCVETSAVWKLSEFGMLSVDPRATRKAGREKNCNSQHSAKLPSHCEFSARGFDRHAGAAL